MNNIQKVTSIQISLNEMYEGLVVTSDLIDAANESYERWDGLLNDIWAVLKNNLSKNEMEKLTNEQRQWIKDKESKAEKNSKEFEGGKMETLTYIDNLSQVTEDRCKVLIERYME